MLAGSFGTIVTVTSSAGSDVFNTMLGAAGYIVSTGLFTTVIVLVALSLNPASFLILHVIVCVPSGNDAVL